MTVKKIDVVGETCPVPLVETRKAIIAASQGDIIEITGTHSASEKEIPMAVKEMDHELLDIREENSKWIIKIKVK